MRRKAWTFFLRNSTVLFAIRLPMHLGENSEKFSTTRSKSGGPINYQCLLLEISLSRFPMPWRPHSTFFFPPHRITQNVITHLDVLVPPLDVFSPPSHNPEPPSPPASPQAPATTFDTRLPTPTPAYTTLSSLDLDLRFQRVLHDKPVRQLRRFTIAKVAKVADAKRQSYDKDEEEDEEWESYDIEYDDDVEEDDEEEEEEDVDVVEDVEEEEVDEDGWLIVDESDEFLIIDDGNIIVVL